MFYNYSMKVSMKNAETAAIAKEILKNRLEEGFAFDNNYRNKPSQEMLLALETIENEVILPEEYGGCLPEDAKAACEEMLTVLAAMLTGESFSCQSHAESDNDEFFAKAQFDGATLAIETTYYPTGSWSKLSCDECGEEVVALEKYEDGKRYVCPHCGEELDLSEEYAETAPVVEKKSIRF